MKWLVLALCAACAFVLTLCSGCAFQVAGVGPGASFDGDGDGDSDGGAGTGGGGAGSPAHAPPPTAPLPAPPGSGPLPPDGGGPVALMSQIGDACDSQLHRCSGGQLCVTRTFFGIDAPGGYCSQDCRSPPCPTGSQCATQWGLCVEDCPTIGCRVGYVCCKQGWQGAGACLPPPLCPNG